MIEDAILTEGLKNSLFILAEHQHELGMIPSNVLPNSNDISFGSLVGRVDANTWFILGCCMLYQHTQDESTWIRLLPAIEKCRAFIRATELNDKGWMYTPLSGNWADEYPIHGYTLYDNMLRLWGEKEYAKITNTAPLHPKQSFDNFWPSTEMDTHHIYHQNAYGELDLDSLHHFIAFILPGKYDARFDAAGNALALLQMELNTSQKKKMGAFIKRLTSEISKPLIPAFWPIITEKSEDWNLLKGNYSFDFKNHPGAFHNGGIWPVWMGLFCLGLAAQGMHEEVAAIHKAAHEAISNDSQWDFQEYINPKTLKFGGKTQMGYSASGIIFMQLALNKAP